MRVTQGLFYILYGLIRLGRSDWFPLIWNIGIIFKFERDYRYTRDAGEGNLREI